MPVTADQISIADFAKSVKTKYPQYKDVPDDVLTKNIIEKYLQYKDKVRMNTPTPAAATGVHDNAKSDMMSYDISKLTNVKAPSEKQPTNLVADAPASIMSDAQTHDIKTQDAANRLTKTFNDHATKALESISNKQLEQGFKDAQSKFNSGQMSEDDFAKYQQNYMHDLMLNKDQRVGELKKQMDADPAFTRKVVEKIGEQNPKIAKQLKSDMYVLDRQKAPEKASKIIKNSRDIENGNLDYNIRGGQLQKNLDFAQSVAEGLHNRNQMLSDYEAYTSGDDASAISKLEQKRNSYDPDEPQNHPGAVGGMVGAQGIMLGKGALAATATNMIPGIGGALAPWAAGLATSPEVYKTGYAASLENNYNELRNKGMESNEAYAKAKERAEFDAKADVAVGIATSVAGARIGLKAFKPKELSPGFINVVKNIAGHVASTTAEGGAAGVIAGGAEALKNIHSGRSADANVLEAAGSQLLFAYGMAGLTHAASAFIKPKTRNVILQNVAKAPEEMVNKTLADLVVHGKVTPEEANTIHAEIESQRESDAKIPASVKSDAARAQIAKKLERRDELEIRLENQSKAFHPETKEKIKVLDEEINEIANGGKQHDEGKEIELPFKEADGSKGAAVVMPEENKQPNVVPLKTDNSINAGDNVQWVSQGADQFSEPKKVTKISPDGKYAFVEGSNTGIPVEQLKAEPKKAPEELPDIYKNMAAQDPVGFKKFISDQIEGGNESEIEKIPGIKPFIDELKNKDNALQESSPSSVLQHTQEGTGETGGERGGMERGEQGEEIAGTSKEGEVKGEEKINYDGKEAGISHARMDEIADEFGFPKYEKMPETFEVWDRQAREALNKDAQGTVTRIKNKLRNDEKVEPWENRAMIMYVADLKARADEGNVESFRELRRLKPLLDVAGKRAALELVSRRGGMPVEKTFSDFLNTEADLKGRDDLTPEERKVVKEEYKDISAKRKKEQDLSDEAKAELAKKRAEKEFQKAQKEAKKSAPKTKEDRAKERDQIIKSIKDKLAKSRGKLSSSVLLGAERYVEIAPDVAKLLISYIHEGVTELSTAVKKIHEHFKEEGVTERDIHNMIAGEYNEKKMTRNEAAEIKKNITDEAKLINKYERLINGKEPQDPKLKSKRTKAIEEIRGKISAFKKEDAEANKFYGESDAQQRKIERMEDELDRLNDLREKAPSGKEKRQPSEKEVNLQKEINEARKVYNQFSKEGQRKILEAAKTRVELQTKAINEKIGKGEFVPVEKREPIHEREELKKANPELHKQLLEARDARLKAEEDRAIRLMKEDYENMPEWEKNARKLSKVAASGRVAKSAFDVSMPGRQGIWALAGQLLEPPAGANKGFKQQRQIVGQFGKMYKSALSEKYFRRVMADIKESSRYPMAQKAGLKIADPNSPLAEAREDIYGPSYAEQIPFIGKPVKYGEGKQIGGLIKSSERNATAFINSTKWNIFNNFVDGFERNGKTFENSKSLYEAAADYSNLSVGRGKIGGTAEKWNTLTSKIFFSLRLQASRLQLMTNILNPKFWAKTPKEIKVAYIKDMVKFVALGMTAMGVADKLGFKVGINPFQADFGKIKIGQTYYDVWGGFSGWATFLARVVAGKTTDSGGHIKHVGERDSEGEITRGRMLLRFTRGKLSPEAGVATDLAVGKDFMGQPVTPLGELSNFGLPLIGSDIWKEVQADHSVSQAVLTAILAAHGVGVNTYAPNTTKKDSSNVKNW